METIKILNEKYHLNRIFAYIGLFSILSNKLIGNTLSFILMILCIALSIFLLLLKDDKTDYRYIVKMKSALFVFIICMILFISFVLFIY